MDTEINKEREELRAQQAAAVMPHIGPLLDAWEQMPNDVLFWLQEEAPDFVFHMHDLISAVEE